MHIYVPKITVESIYCYLYACFGDDHLSDNQLICSSLRKVTFSLLATLSCLHFSV